MKTQWLSKFISAIMIVILGLTALPVTPARAASTGFVSPTSCSSATWTNPNDAISSNNVRATAGGDGNELECSFNLPAIPAGNGIAGIEVTVEGTGSNTRDVLVELSWDAGVSYTGGDPLVNLGNTEQVYTVGGTTDTWGRTWDVGDFTAANFRVKVYNDGDFGTSSIDHVQVNVHYFPSYTITATAGAGGTITPSGVVDVIENSNQSFDITPNTSFIVADVVVDLASVGRANAHTFTTVTSNHTISATFDGGWYQPSADTDNGWSNEGDAYVSDNNYGVANNNNEDAEFFNFGIPLPPSATINGIEVAVEGNSTGSREVAVDLSSGGGFTTGDPSTTFTNGGADATFLFGGSTDLWGRAWTPANIANLRVRLTSNNGTGDVNIDQVQVKVHFTAVSHTITATAGAGGTITPSGAVIVYDSLDQSFDITPNTSFIVSDVVVDLASAGRPNAYTFTNVTGNHTISATFDGGWTQPSADTDNGWTNEANAYVSDNNYGVSNNNNEDAEFFNFGISIPGGSTINGIEVAVEGNATGSREVAVDLSSGGGFTTGDPSTTFTNGGVDATFLFGGSADLWGRAWTTANIANLRVRLTSNNGTGDVNIDQVQVKVHFTPPNTAPTGGNDSVTTNEDTLYTFQVSDFTYNDADSDPFAGIRVTSLETAGDLECGAVDVALNDTCADVTTLTFNPAANANGTPYATFQFEVFDGTAYSASSYTMTVNVTAVDDVSVANDDTSTVGEDSGANTIDVRGNDTDIDSAVELIQSVTQPTNGTVVITNGGADLTYAPNANYCNGGSPTDDFTYTLAGGDSATVAITVTCVDDASVANDDTATVGEDSGANTINVRGNDTDIDSAVELIQSVTQPTNGTVVITNGGADLTYAPNANYCNGGTPTDDFTYTLAGGDSATVAVTVTCVDDASAANDDTATVGEDSGANMIDVRGNDTDIDSAVELIQSVTQPTNGTVVITNGGADLTYAPNANYCNGGSPTDDFTYTLAGGSTGDVDVTVTCADDPSTANDDTATVLEDSGTNTIDVRANDTDVDSATELIQSVAQPTNGTVVITNGGTDLTYQPNAEYCNGGTPTDDFTYTLTGGDSATVAVTVTCQTAVIPSIIADNKVYNGDAAATFTCSLSGVTPPDDVSCSGGSASFDNENVGAGKPVTATGLGLSGADAALYELSTTSATDNADITARDLNVTATGVNKVYDGNTNATVTLSDDSIVTDDVVVSYTSASFLDPNVGANKPVMVTGISISGGLDAGNYSLVNTTANTTADITIAGQTITITQNAPASAANGTTFDVAATASSGLPVTITTSSSCSGGDTDGGATITMTSGTGTCNVFYDQAGNSNYDPAPQLQEVVNATESPVFTSADNTAFDLGFAGSFNITATGNPQTMTISVSGTLPTGVTFADNGNGTASFSGTPGAGTAGVYNLILTADNGVVPNGIQNFTLTVKNGPIIGADGVNSTPDTGNGSISENEIISTTLGITQLTVEFSQDVYDPAGDSDADDVTNPANYMLARSATGTFATSSCVLGVTAPDVAISVDSVTYANNGGSGPFIATLNINSGLPLNVEGFYRLYTCGTTSIVDAVNTGLILAGDGVNPGTDFVRNFRVSAPTSGGGGGGGGGDDTVASAISQGGVLIPVTGFAPNQTTNLAAQNTEYAATKLALDIPTLGLNLPIVGVDFKQTGWDVTWLGANAGYLEGSAYPTWTGNTVLTGHVTDPNGKPGPFAYINELKPGEKIYIHNNGFTYVYEVRQSSLILPSSVKTLFKHEDDTWLSLVTCENFNTKTNAFSNRRMVRAVLISIIPAK